MLHKKETNKFELILSCPYCLNSSLKLTDKGNFTCNEITCSMNQKNFNQILGKPVLINFQDSVFKEENFQINPDGSVLNRQKTNLGDKARNLLWGINKKAEINAEIFLNRILKSNHKPTILVVGGGKIGSGSNALYNNSSIQLISFDVYCSEYTDFVADAHCIPIKDDCIDGVWIQAVLEHVLEPTKVVAEIYRVLKPDGIVYAETPFMQQVHEKAYDFTRFTESGHRWLFRNFELLDSGVVLGPGTALIWSIRYFFGALFRSKNLGTIFGLLFFWLRFLDNLIPENYSSDAASGVFFMGKKSGSPIQYHEIIDFYKGTR